jgi:putative transcriptional regulator
MPIIINVDVMLAKTKTRSKELAEAIGITEQNLSILKTGKAKAIRFSTLEAICRHLNCQPGDILEYIPQGLNPPPSYQKTVEKECTEVT